ncbi:MAG: ABC transporter permease [Clostridia bacterium]|nr:ABC transporter permease [Clostridia bacterium]
MNRRLKRPRRGAVTLSVGLFMMAAMLALALLAPLVCRYDPLEQDLYAFLQPPGGAHPFGTDQLGRDMFSRVAYAARTDLRIMALAEIAPFVTGLFLGMLSGYYGGWVEWLVILATDAFIAFPYYLLVIVVAFATGAGAHGIYITFMLVGWLLYARVARGATASLRESEWLQAARMMGYSDMRVIWRELFPNVLPQAVVVLMTDMAGLLAIIVTLGYLGIGVTPPTPDWGAMIAEGQNFMTTAWWLSVIPGLMVVYTGIALSFIGDGLADIWN